MIIDAVRPPAPRHRPGRDPGVARLARRRRSTHRARAGPQFLMRSCSSGPASCRSASPPRSARPTSTRSPPDQEERLVPRRRAHRAPHPRLHPLERGGDGGQGQQARRRHRRPPGHVRVVGRALRGRLQPLLPRQGRRPARRPRLHPGPRRARHLRPRVPRGPARPRSSSTTSAGRSAATACRATRTRG